MTSCQDVWDSRGELSQSPVARPQVPEGGLVSRLFSQSGWCHIALAGTREYEGRGWGCENGAHMLMLNDFHIRLRTSLGLWATSVRGLGGGSHPSISPLACNTKSGRDGSKHPLPWCQPP